MRLAKAAFFLFLFAAWLPSTISCEAKRAVLPILDCCLDDSAPEGRETNCNHCQFCTALESGGYKLSDTRTIVPERQSLELIAPTETAAVQVRQREVLVTDTTSPPDIPSGWQFSQRAALPPRAPSVAS